MKVIYIADDGKQFDDEDECLDYEWTLKHPHIKDVHFYDAERKELVDIFGFDTYMNVETIIVDSNKAIQDLCALADYTGYYVYKMINEKGTWTWGNSIEGTYKDMRTKIKCKRNNIKSKNIERALDAYRDLLLDGCLKIPCQECKHYIDLSDYVYYRSTCKRDFLLDILLPEYQDEVSEIDKELKRLKKNV